MNEDHLAGKMLKVRIGEESLIYTETETLILKPIKSFDYIYLTLLTKIPDLNEF